MSMLHDRLSRLVQICTGTNSGAGEELLQLEGMLEKLVHFCTMVIRHFIKNRCLVRASSLAFTTLLALIPLLAVAVGITSSLLKSEGEDQIYRAIDRAVSTLMPPATMLMTNGQIVTVIRHPGFALTNPMEPAGILGLDDTNLISSTNLTEIVGSTNALTLMVSTNTSEDGRMVTAQKEAARSIHDYIQNAQSGKVGIAGMIVFIITAIGMLRGVENTFNDIWGVTVDRRWWHQLSSYFTIVALGPVVLVAGASLAGGHFLHMTNHWVARIPVLGWVVLQIGPLAILWLVFALFYMLIPNTRVKFSAAFLGGMVAGTLWHLNNIFAFLYVSRVVTNSAIYGKLGLVPVFMLGLYFSWVILLFGAQVAYACQNRVAYLQDRIADNVNQRGREFVALRIMMLLGQRFQNGLPPARVLELSTELGIPSRLTQRVLRTLADAQLITQAACEGDAFMPARPLETINAHHILCALRTGSGKQLLVDNTPSLAALYGDFAGIEAAERAAAEKISVLTLVQHLPAPLTLANGQKGELVASMPAAVEPQKLVAVEFSTESKPASKVAEPEISQEQVLTKNTLATIIDTPTVQESEAPVAAKEKRPASGGVAQPKETDFPL
jgi:membrane protein